MRFVQAGDIRYAEFESLHELGVTQAVFTRQGGVSDHPWDSLNLGGTVGDAQENVRTNQARALQALGRSPHSVYDVWQVHGADVVCTDRPRPAGQEHRKADAILTNQPDVTLLMRFADCVPILLVDPVHKVVGLVHAGWQGTVKKTVLAAVQTMQEQYKSVPADMFAAIGPSIGPDHYEVGEDVIQQVKHVFGPDANNILAPANGNARLDLWAANRLILEEARVGHVELSGICTACHPQDWYSHRAQKGHTGRFGAVIALSA